MPPYSCGCCAVRSPVSRARRIVDVVLGACRRGGGVMGAVDWATHIGLLHAAARRGIRSAGHHAWRRASWWRSRTLALAAQVLRIHEFGEARDLVSDGFGGWPVEREPRGAAGSGCTPRSGRSRPRTSSLTRTPTSTRRCCRCSCPPRAVALRRRARWRCVSRWPIQCRSSGSARSPIAGGRKCWSMAGPLLAVVVLSAVGLATTPLMLERFSSWAASAAQRSIRRRRHWCYAVADHRKGFAMSAHRRAARWASSSRRCCSRRSSPRSAWRGRR